MKLLLSICFMVLICSGCAITNPEQAGKLKVEKVKITALTFSGCHGVNVNKARLRQWKEIEIVQSFDYILNDSTRYYTNTLGVDTTKFKYKDFRARIIFHYIGGKRMKMYIAGTSAIVIGKTNYKNNMGMVAYIYSLLPARYEVYTEKSINDRYGKKLSK